MRNYHSDLKELCCQTERVYESKPVLYLSSCVTKPHALAQGTGALVFFAVSPLQPVPKETYFVVQSVNSCSSSLNHVPNKKKLTTQSISLNDYDWCKNT